MITLNYRDSRPIYEQISESYRKLIISGVLAAGEKLPSVRSLAMELSINPNTIQRAFGQLEQEGYICCIAGKGNFVTGSIENGRKEKLIKEFSEKASELKYLGVSEDNIKKIISDIYKEESK